MQRLPCRADVEQSPPASGLTRPPDRRRRPLLSYSHLLTLHIFSLIAFLAATVRATRPEACAAYPEPFSQHRRLLNSSAQCRHYTHDTPRFLCEVRTHTRLSRLSEIYVFDSEAPVALIDLFRVSDAPKDDVKSLARLLKEGETGRDCLVGDSSHCERCFRRLGERLARANDASIAFDKTLHRFDCMPAVDTASATRPFSPNGSCPLCKVWYRRWLVVNLVDMWRQPPCVNWCYYAQLACPHLATSKVVDYAGHPSFQCRDQNIPQTSGLEAHDYGSGVVSTCGCVHPCDFRGFIADREHAHLAESPSDVYDFYASPQHCETRRRQCANRTNTSHDRSRSSPPPSPPSSSTPVSSSAGLSPLSRLLLFLLLLELLTNSYPSIELVTLRL